MTPVNSPGLSSAQQNLIVDAANRVPPAWRQRFLSEVADRLMGISQSSVVTNYDVSDAIVRVAARIRDAPASCCEVGPEW